MFDPTTQQPHDFLDVLQKTEAQKFIDKVIYSKLQDHVENILNRTYSEDKPYNDIALHFGREMRLNGLWTSDESLSL